jgi:hypothetical protein
MQLICGMKIYDKEKLQIVLGLYIYEGTEILQKHFSICAKSVYA